MKAFFLLIIGILSSTAILSQDSLMQLLIGQQLYFGRRVPDSLIDYSLSESDIIVLNKRLAPIYVMKRMAFKKTQQGVKSAFLNVDSTGKLSAVVLLTDSSGIAEKMLNDVAGAPTGRTGITNSNIRITTNSWRLTNYCAMSLSDAYERCIIFFNCRKESFFYYPNLTGN